MNFWADLANIIRAKKGYEQTLSDGSVIEAHFEQKFRILPVKKWAVFRSKNFNSQIPKHILPYIDKIEKKAANGESLYSHHSTRIENLLSDDRMLYDWGIFHLHPGHGKKKNDKGFVNRSEELLFVFPDKEKLFFVHLGTHKNFTCKKILEELCTNWPDTLAPYRVPMSLHYSIKTEEDISNRRKFKLNYAIEICGNVYAPPGKGFSVSLNDGKAQSSIVTDHCVYLRSTLKKAENDVFNFAVQYIGTHESTHGNIPKLKLTSASDTQFIINESTSGINFIYHIYDGTIEPAIPQANYASKK